MTKDNRLRFWSCVDYFIDELEDIGFLTLRKNDPCNNPFCPHDFSKRCNHLNTLARKLKTERRIFSNMFEADLVIFVVVLIYLDRLKPHVQLQICAYRSYYIVMAAIVVGIKMFNDVVDAKTRDFADIMELDHMELVLTELYLLRMINWNTVVSSETLVSRLKELINKKKT